MATGECVISAFARRTPLRDEEKILALQRYASVLQKDNGDHDPILPFYLHLLLHGTPQEKMRAAREHPDLVERCFTLFHDRELGQLYVNHYGASKDRHHTAYFISVELGAPIERRLPKSEEGYVYDKDIRDLFRMSTAQGIATNLAHQYRINGSHQKH